MWGRGAVCVGRAGGGVLRPRHCQIPFLPIRLSKIEARRRAQQARCAKLLPYLPDP